jgi:hypothetical protein
MMCRIDNRKLGDKGATPRMRIGTRTDVYILTKKSTGFNGIGRVIAYVTHVLDDISCPTKISEAES